MIYVLCSLVILAAFGYMHYRLVREQAFVLVEEIKSTKTDIAEAQPSLHLVHSQNCDTFFKTLKK